MRIRLTDNVKVETVIDIHRKDIHCTAYFISLIENAFQARHLSPRPSFIRIIYSTKAQPHFTVR